MNLVEMENAASLAISFLEKLELDNSFCDDIGNIFKSSDKIYRCRYADYMGIYFISLKGIYDVLIIIEVRGFEITSEGWLEGDMRIKNQLIKRGTPYYLVEDFSEAMILIGIIEKSLTEEYCKREKE